MAHCPYTPKQVEAIAVLDRISGDIKDFISGLSDDRTWIAQVLNASRPLLKDAFSGLTLYDQEVSELLPASDLHPKVARAEFVSYVNYIRTTKDDDETLRCNLKASNMRFLGLIACMAKYADLHDEVC